MKKDEKVKDIEEARMKYHGDMAFVAEWLRLNCEEESAEREIVTLLKILGRKEFYKRYKNVLNMMKPQETTEKGDK